MHVFGQVPPSVRQRALPRSFSQHQLHSRQWHPAGTFICFSALFVWSRRRPISPSPFLCPPFVLQCKDKCDTDAECRGFLVSGDMLTCCTENAAGVAGFHDVATPMPITPAPCSGCLGDSSSCKDWCGANTGGSFVDGACGGNPFSTDPGTCCTCSSSFPSGTVSSPPTPRQAL